MKIQITATNPEILEVIKAEAKTALLSSRLLKHERNSRSPRNTFLKVSGDAEELEALIASVIETLESDGKIEAHHRLEFGLLMRVSSSELSPCNFPSWFRGW